MDQPSKRFLSDVGIVLFILLVSIALYWAYPFPGVLLAGGLAITVWVVADIVLFRKS